MTTSFILCTASATSSDAGTWLCKEYADGLKSNQSVSAQTISEPFGRLGTSSCFSANVADINGCRIFTSMLDARDYQT